MITGKQNLMNTGPGSVKETGIGIRKGRGVLVTNARTIYKSIGAMAGLLLCLAPMLTEAGNLYRYRNSEGNLVIDHQVPPQYIPKGYEIITESGRVEEVVPPQVEKTESAEQSAVSTAEVARQLEEDQMLLRSYSSLNELQGAGVRRLEQLAREIDIIESNMAKNQRQLQQFRERAAQYQFNGETLPDSLLKNIDGVLLAQRDAEQMMELRRAEYRGMELRYQRYADRFTELTAKRASE